VGQALLADEVHGQRLDGRAFLEGDAQPGQLRLVEGLAADLQVAPQGEVVLHLLVKPDGDEAAEVDVRVEVAQEHLGGVEGAQLGEADAAQVLDPVLADLGAVHLLEGDVGAERPAGTLEPVEELVVEHAAILAVPYCPIHRPSAPTLALASWPWWPKMASA
jgi:hypothetical protein